MRIGVPRERVRRETRVALVPESVERLVEAGHTVLVDAGAGSGAAFPDEAYGDAGAGIVRGFGDVAGADVVAAVRLPVPEQIEMLRPGGVLVGFLAPLADPDGVERLSERGVVGFAMESVPRITRAQGMDALSSQATVSGYKAALIAADRLPRFFPLLMTAAGTVPPVKEQVESLGAVFLELGVRGEETEGGYARELTPDEQRRQQEELEQRLPEFDAVITTALVPGRPAPVLIPAAAVAAMRPGSVIVDLAAETGGNCELTEPDEEVDAEGVTIVGWTNLPATMPADASRLYARNVVALLLHLAPEGELHLDWEDEIVSTTCVTRREQVSA